MFYMLVPAPTPGINGVIHTAGFVDSLTPSVLAHEFQHLINAGRRIYVNSGATSFEESAERGAQPHRRGAALLSREQVVAAE